MATSRLVPDDPRVSFETAQIRGKTYRYTLSKPQGTPVATMVLIHGFPDTGFGWRHQVPYFTSLGFQVVVPDMLGYAGTDAPQDLSHYSLKSVAADIKELSAKFVGNDGQIILGGHDWGGAVVWRIALWYPELLKGVFSVCTPYTTPNKTFVPLETLVSSGVIPQFGYQLQFKGPDVQERLQGPQKIREFLTALFGGRGNNGEVGFRVSDGVQFDNLSLLNPSPLLSAEELAHYVKEYTMHDAPSLRGPLNWYRTREINHEEELPLSAKNIILEMPALFISASMDAALPPAMSLGMDKSFKDLTRGEVDATHWALTQAGDEVNEQVKKWVTRVLESSPKASL